MAAVIESHIRQELQDFQGLVDAVLGAGAIGSFVPPEHVQHYGFLMEYLGNRLWADFEILQRSICQGFEPSPPDIGLVVSNE